MIVGAMPMMLGGGGGAILRVQDTFTESSNTDLTVHTPDIDLTGGGWSDSGTWTVNATNDDARVTVAGATGSLPQMPNRAWIDDSLSIAGGDFRITVNAKHNGGGYPATLGGIIFGQVDNTNYYRASFYGYDNTMQISKIAGSDTTIASQSFTNTWDTWYSLDLRVENGVAYFSIDGGAEISGALDNATLNASTKHGLGAITWANESHLWQFDDFEYWRL